MFGIIQSLLEIIFPPVCLACKKYLSSQTLRSKTWEENNKEIFLCENCESKIEINNSFFCPECNRRLPFSSVIASPDNHRNEAISSQSVIASPDNHQNEAISRQFEINRLKPITYNLKPNPCHSESKFILAAASSYQNTIVREIIHSLKYGRATAALKPIEKIIKLYLEKIIPDSIVNSHNFVIVPIPLHSSKLRSRGFNQSELIAKKLAAYCSLPTTHCLIRIKNTASQTKLKKEERLKNIENCFTLKNPQEISGKNIILVDDVFTSGATMREAVKILKNAGAKNII